LSNLNENLLGKAKEIELIAFDVDGVLTDGRIGYDSAGNEIKYFHVRDGHAIKMAHRAGVRIALITGRSSPMVDLRAAELGIEHVYQGAKDKVASLNRLLSATDLNAAQVAYLVDIPVIVQVGLGCSVGDAPEEVREIADYITNASGGMGAARELIVFILKSKGLWEGLMERYLK
jgi:3-deoxy-D-manno-octulosonate 8-phosphate phosphatase (KDO 8-P phosphatase)